MAWRTEATIWATWVGVTSVISTAGYSVFAWDYQPEHGRVAMGQFLGAIVILLVLLPAAQALILRRRVPRAWQWVPATLIGGQVSLVIPLLLQQAGLLAPGPVSIADRAFWLRLGVGMAGALVLGIVQARVLGLASRRARWWRSVPPLSALLEVVGSYYCSVWLWSITPEIARLIYSGLGWTVFALVFSASTATLSGLVLMWILGDGRPSPPPPRRVGAPIFETELSDLR